MKMTPADTLKARKPITGSMKKMAGYKEKIAGHKKKRINRSLKGDLALLFWLLVLGAFMILPFIYSIVQSLKPVEELFLFPPRFFVRRPTLENYEMLFKLAGNLWVPFGRYALNSILVAAIVTSAHVILSSMAAFPLAKVKFPGSNLIFRVVLMSLLFVSQVTGIMQYVLMARAHMIDTFWALILPSVAAPLGLFLMKQFMMQIPEPMLEAAYIDGARPIYTWWHIVMPNVKPAWLTLSVFAFQSAWGITGGSFIYNESLKTLPTILSQIAASGIARAGVGAASAVVLMLPPAVLFIFTQSKIIETMTHSGIKE